MKKQVKYPYTLTEIFIFLVVSIFILFPGTNGYISIQDEKSIFFYWLFGGYLAVMGLFTLEMMIGGWIKPVSPASVWKKFTWTQRFVVLYFFFSFISTILSPYRQWSLFGMSRHEGLITIGLYCAVFLCVSIFAPSKLRFINIFACSMILFSSICLLQMSGYNPLHLYPEGLRYSDANKLYAGIYVGTIGNADLVAALLCLSIPFFFSQLKKENKQFNPITILAAILCMVVLVLLDVKAAFVGLAVGVWVSIPACITTNQHIQKIILLIVILSMLLGLLVIWIFPLGGILSEAHQLLHGNWDDTFGSGRVYIWKEVWKRIPPKILFGHGPDTMMALGIPGFDFTSWAGQTHGTFIDTAHNEYLNVLFHQGIFALLSYFGILITCFLKWFQASHRTSYASGLGCAVMCYCWQAMFGISMCITAGLFWVILALFEHNLNSK